MKSAAPRLSFISQKHGVPLDETIPALQHPSDFITQLDATTESTLTNIADYLEYQHHFQREIDNSGFISAKNLYNLTASTLRKAGQNDSPHTVTQIAGLSQEEHTYREFEEICKNELGEATQLNSK